MMTRLVHIAKCATLATVIVMAGVAHVGAVDLGKDVPEALPPQLNASVTISGEVVRLSDLFSGELSRGDKVIGQAPAPGQRVVLAADWLANVAKTNGVNWKPDGQFDRAVVFRPGRPVPSQDVLTAVRAALHANGMPGNFGLRLLSPMAQVTIAADAEPHINVREAIFEPTTGQFSAVAEISPGHSSVQYVQLRGMARAVSQVPQLRQSFARDTLISADMIDMVEVPEASVPPDAVVDPDQLIGKSLRIYARSAQILRQSDVYDRKIESIPVLRSDMRRGDQITEADIEWLEVTTADIPVGTIKDADMIVGKSPKRAVMAGVAIRDNDVAALTLVDLPIALRDVARGAMVRAEDIGWKRVPETDIVGSVVRAENELVGRIANNHIRAGQPFRTVNVALPVAMPKGKAVTLLFNSSVMSLTARGKALEDGAIGQVIRIANTKSNNVVMAEVIDANTVRVTEQQTAMN